MEHPLAAFPQGQLWHLVEHFAPSFSLADVALELAPSPPANNDDPIAERLIGVFHAMRHHELNEIAPEDRPNAGLWEMMKHEFHGEFYRLLENCDVPGVATHMRSALRKNTTWGLGPGQVVFDAMNMPGPDRNGAILLTLDRLVSLAEAVGALPMENPEQGRYGKSLVMSVGDLVAAIEARIGDIYRPPVMGMFGLSAGPGRIIDVRVPDDAYGAWRILQVRAQYGLQTVCEIGAGFGGCAFQTLRAGLDAPFTIIDLPLVCLISGYFLMKIYGSGAVSMFSEEGPRRINVLPYWEFFDRGRTYDLVFNRDSLPEMPIARADEYLDEISARGATFLSINQESGGSGGQGDLVQLNVNSMMAARPDMELISRHRHWTRRGYVEELYRRKAR